MNISTFLASINPKTRTAAGEIAMAITLLCLAYFIGCEHGKSLHTEVVGLGEVQTHESWKADTTITPLATTEHGSFVAKGQPLANGKIQFHASVKTENGEGQIEQTYDPKDTTLSGKLIAIITLQVPQIVLTHSIQSYIPIQTTQTIKDESSNWTFAGVGAAIGSLLTIVFLFAIHVL
jgi:hypothetical protein